MKISMIDIEGVSNAVVVKALLFSKYSQHEYKVLAASEKTSKLKTRKSTKRLTKEVLGLDLDIINSTPATLEDLIGSDVIIVENKNNIKLLEHRFKGSEPFKEKKVINLNVESLHRAKNPEEQKQFLIKLVESINKECSAL